MPFPAAPSSTALDLGDHDSLPGWLSYLLTIATATLVVPGVVFRDGGVTPVAVVAGVAAVAAALLLERRPTVLPWVSVTVLVGGVVLVTSGQSSNVAWFTMVMLGGCIESRFGARPGNLFLVATAILYGVLAVLQPDAGWAAWMVGTALAVGGSRVGWRQRALVVELRAAQAELAQQAAAEERNRIARELHDVIAHTLTVSLLHITGARLAVEHDPDDAAAALAEAERLGRESLTEVRRAVGLLRDGGGGPASAPLPTMTNINDLVSGFVEAGLPVSLTVTGDLAPVPPAVGLSAYRITQEALTNAAKYAAGRGASVAVTAGDAEVLIEVTNPLPDDRGSGRSDPGGLGVVGMRERARLLGGTLHAGPAGDRWVVTARLPVSTARPVPTTAS